MNADGETVKIPASKIQISGATAEELTQPGKHVVDVLIYFVDENNELVAQQKSVTVNNYYSVIEATDIFFTFDGENVDGSTDADYTGEDFTEKMAFEVYAGKKLLTEGTDYTVVYEQQQKDGKWVEVDSIVDAADYRITVKAANEGILISGGEFKFTVNRALLTAVPNGLVWDWADSSSDHDRSFLPYTGAVQDVTFKFTNADGETVEVPADSYDVVISVYGQTKESEVKEKGKYIARFDDDEVANYDLPADKTFWVDDAKSFSDVHDSDWYLGSVFQAKENGYVHGISGTDMFAPEQDIKRGDVVVILFNMANGKYDADKDFGYVEGAGYMTGFDDVESTMYYTQAIAWAKATGVVNGYDGTNDFRPDAPVTREEFAAMLSNYAELTGVDVVGAEADLSAFDDAVQVSGWAKEAVEWTVSAKVMGNGGFLAPQANITRAEVAAMAVNFQPEML